MIFPNSFEYKNDYYFVNNNLKIWEPEIYHEIIIPKDTKTIILKELKEAGITESFLFPEPEKICLDIKNRYKKRLNYRDLEIIKSKKDEADEICIP